VCQSDCRDPKAHDEDCGCSGDVKWIGDGHCDEKNNVPTCRFDGGDCCQSSCVDGLFHCATSGACAGNCLDPLADDTACIGVAVPGAGTATGLSSAVRHEHKMGTNEAPPALLLSGDGHCDSINNNEFDGWDGGDCCHSTCKDSKYPCRQSGVCHAECLDPVGTNEGCPPDIAGVCISGWKGDGHCDKGNNNNRCDWDGGDCCYSTCTDSVYPCLESGVCRMPCYDPYANDEECAALPDAGQGPAKSAEEITTLKQKKPSCGSIPDHHLEWVGDGHCDPVNNDELCDWDGGDCCYSTCVPASGVLVCKISGVCQSRCLNPDANDNGCGCDGEPEKLGNGRCDTLNNNPQCKFDHGDCCASTCKDAEYSCTKSKVCEYPCLDSEGDDFGCHAGANV